MYQEGNEYLHVMFFRDIFPISHVCCHRDHKYIPMLLPDRQYTNKYLLCMDLGIC